MLDRKTPPPTHPFDKLTIPEQTVIYPAPGITLHLIDNGQLPANRISVYWKCGASAPGFHSAAGFVSPMLQEGTANFSGEDIANMLDFNGAWLRNRGDNHYTGLSLISLNETTPKMLELLADMILNPVFPQKAFDALKQKSAMAKRMSLSKVSGIAARRMSIIMSGNNHPYLYPETPEDLESVDMETVRRAHATGTRHTEMHVFAGGCLTTQLKDVIIEFCRKIAPGNIVTAAKIAPLSPMPPVTESIPFGGGATQAAVVCAIPAIERTHPDYTELRHVVIALGGYFGSRLMSNIREEKGLTYGISASLMGTFEGAYTNISAQCDNAYTQRVIQEIGAEMEALANTPFPDDELSRLKREITSNLAATLETPFSIMEYYENEILVGTPRNYFEHQFSTINNLTSSRIRYLAGEYLNPRNMRIVYTTPL